MHWSAIVHPCSGYHCIASWAAVPRAGHLCLATMQICELKAPQTLSQLFPGALKPSVIPPWLCAILDLFVPSTGLLHRQIHLCVKTTDLFVVVFFCAATRNVLVRVHIRDCCDVNWHVTRRVTATSNSKTCHNIAARCACPSQHIRAVWEALNALVVRSSLRQRPLGLISSVPRNRLRTHLPIVNVCTPRRHCAT